MTPSQSDGELFSLSRTNQAKKTELASRFPSHAVHDVEHSPVYGVLMLPDPIGCRRLHSSMGVHHWRETILRMLL